MLKSKWHFIKLFSINIPPKMSLSFSMLYINTCMYFLLALYSIIPYAFLGDLLVFIFIFSIHISLYQMDMNRMNLPLAPSPMSGLKIKFI